MSHNNDNIQGNTPDVNSNVITTLSYDQTLGRVLNNTSGQTGSGSGYYSASSPNNYYLFFTGGGNYAGNATVSGDTITLEKGTYFILCVPTFGDVVSTTGNTEMRAQFVDADDNPLGNKGTVNRNNNADFPASGLFSAYVTGPAQVKLKVISVSGSTHFRKDGTETDKTPYFLDILRIN